MKDDLTILIRIKISDYLIFAKIPYIYLKINLLYYEKQKNDFAGDYVGTLNWYFYPHCGQ